MITKRAIRTARRMNSCGDNSCVIGDDWIEKSQ